MEKRMGRINSKEGTAMTITELKKELKTPRGAYLFYGEEEYLKRYYLEQVRGAVVPDEGLAIFNHVKLSGTEALRELDNALGTLPVMAEQKLVEIRDIAYGALKADELKALCQQIAEADADQTVVVLYASKEELTVQPKKPDAVCKALFAAAKPVAFDTQTPAKLASWIKKHFDKAEIEVDAAVCLDLVSYCSGHMDMLSHEIKKLIEYKKQQGEARLSKEDVRKVCCRVEEIAAFDFANAILQGNRARAYTILCDFEGKKQKPQSVLASIAAVYGDLYRIKLLAESGRGKKEISQALRMHEYRVGLYLDALRGRALSDVARRMEACYQADVKIKSTPLPKFGLLASLIVS
ncbi:MAG: DNA polymerase III subunit delta [Clostridiales bacterium]|nr:DNA polymerase III subunit delta [Clostridiales bacterium]